MARTKLENLLMELENRHWSWAETEGQIYNCKDKQFDRLLRISKQFNQQYYETREVFVKEIKRLENTEVLFKELVKVMAESGDIT